MINPYRFGTEGPAGGLWVQVHDNIYGGSDGSVYSSTINDAGNRIIVSATYGDNGPDINSGYVKAYSNVGSEWLQVGQTLYGEAEYNYFGGAVNINNSGDTFITSAYLASSNTGGQYSGKVYVYKLINGTWSQVGQTIEGIQGGLDKLGSATAINAAGTRIAIGNWNYTSTGGQRAGIVRIYK